MALPKWVQIAFRIVPQVLVFTPLAPIALAVTAGIAEAQQIAGATGTQKLAHVVAIAKQAAIAANAQAGKVVLDPDQVQATAGSIISDAVGVVNIVHQASDNAHAQAETEHDLTTTALSEVGVSMPAPDAPAAPAAPPAAPKATKGAKQDAPQSDGSEK